MTKQEIQISSWIKFTKFILRFHACDNDTENINSLDVLLNTKNILKKRKNQI